MSQQTDADKLQRLRREAAEVARRDPPGSARVLRGWITPPPSSSLPKSGAGR